MSTSSLTRVHCLASGSSGNALVLSHGSNALLVDAGISCRRIIKGFAFSGIDISSLNGILITHTHVDHISGLQTILKKADCCVYASDETCRQLDYRFAGIRERLCPLPLLEPYSLGAFTVTAFPTSHDAPGSCGFRIDAEDGSFGLMTDTGLVPEEALTVLSGVNLAVLEANHDVETLRAGRYPFYLKKRILGPGGHLSNEIAAALAVELAQSGTSSILLAHLSQENNTPELAFNAVSSALERAGLSPGLFVLPRESACGPFPLISVSGVGRDYAASSPAIK